MLHKEVVYSFAAAALVHAAALFAPLLPAAQTLEPGPAAPQVIEVELTPTLFAPVRVAAPVPASRPPEATPPPPEAVAELDPSPAPVPEIPTPDPAAPDPAPLAVPAPPVEPAPPAAAPLSEAPPPLAAPPPPLAAPPSTGAPEPAVLAGAGPEYIRIVRPVYPRAALQLRQQGLVVLELTIDAAGRAEQVTVQHSSGFPLLDQAAIAAAKRSRYRPAKKGSLAVRSKAEAPYRFELPD